MESDDEETVTISNNYAVKYLRLDHCNVDFDPKNNWLSLKEFKSKSSSLALRRWIDPTTIEKFTVEKNLDEFAEYISEMQNLKHLYVHLGNIKNEFWYNTDEMLPENIESAEFFVKNPI